MTDAAAGKLIERPLPRGLYGERYQGGITDPLWPFDYDQTVRAPLPPAEGKPPAKAELVTPVAGREDSGTEEATRERYASEYAGRIARQDFLTLLRADLLTADRETLRRALVLLTRFIVEEAEKEPSAAHIGVLEDVPRSYRVTVTLGLGATLFVDRTGEDRFGLRARRPKGLKMMPSFPGDAGTFDAGAAASDLILAIASDHPYVNTAIARFFGEYFNRRFCEMHERKEPVLRFRQVEQGFARKDKREFLRFDDGIQNLQMHPGELERLVYVTPTDGEPDWCAHGSYLVYRKIREDMPRWEMLADDAQEAMIGREKKSGLPLSRRREGAGSLIPVFADHKDEADGRLNAHVRKVQPRRRAPDLFGLDDLERQFLRRPYPYFEGLDAEGRSTNGLHFLAFMKSVQQQFEHVTNMWQMNPDFPTPGTGVDALYAREILSTVDGGYYFCPPGLTGKGDFLGSGLFA